jgi:hypothetical protein
LKPTGGTVTHAASNGALKAERHRQRSAEKQRAMPSIKIGLQIPSRIDVSVVTALRPAELA